MKFCCTCLVFFITVFLHLGCKKTVDVDSGYEVPSVVNPNIDQLIVTSPQSTPFYSNDSSLVIEGVCRKNSKVLLKGDEEKTVDCTNQSFALSVQGNTDRTYNYILSQKTGSVETSGKSLTWVRKSSVAIPALTQPSENPFTSADTVLEVQGGCETGARVVLGGDVSGEALCVSSNFSIEVFKFIDGDYNVDVTQIDQAGNQASVSFVWSRVGLEVTPDNPQVRVTRDQVFTINGGTPNYTVTFIENNSGGSYNSSTRTYTAGTVSGVVDRIEVVDANGFSDTVDISVIPDVPDHFVFPDNDGNDQNQTVGFDFLAPLVAKVVDRFGNAVANIDVLFKNVAGSVFFNDPSLQTTDSEGLVRLNVKQGFTSNRSSIVATTPNVSLEDVNSTGARHLNFQTLTNSENTGTLGLNFTIGNGGEDTVSDDFNGDGISDVIVLNKNDQLLSVFLGGETGVLDKQANITNLCNGASSIISDDFNSDGFKDLALTCASAEFYYIFMGRGDGTFDTALQAGTDVDENLVIDAASGDIDGDGAVDLVMVSAGTNKVSVRFGNNDGTFAGPVLYDTGSSPTQVSVSDLDGQNGNDIIVLNSASESVFVYFNDGSGNLSDPESSTHSTGLGPAGLAVVDLTNDGLDDFVVTSNIEDKISVYVNLGGGNFSLPNDTAVGSSPASVHSFDYNGDNFNDLFVTNIGDSTVSVLSGNGNGSFATEAPLRTLITPLFVNSGDINNDGNQDLLVVASGESKLQAFLGDGQGALGLKTEVGVNPLKVLSADFDQDGFRDKAIVSGGDNAIQILSGNNKGNYTLTDSLTSGVVSPTNAIVADFNNDSLMDLAVINSGNSTVAVFINIDGAGFEAARVAPLGTQPTGIVSGDFNSDGFMDVAITNSGSNSFSTYFGDGTGDLSGRIDKTTGSQPTAIETADFNNDQVLDIVLVNQSEATDNVSIFMGNGDGTFQNPASYSAESGPNGIVVGYLNADSFLDVAVSNSLSASVSVFLGQSGGALQSASNYLAGANPEHLIMGDINGDSRQDLLIANGLNQKVTVLFGNLAGNFSTSTEIDSFVNSVFLELDDSNQDGAVDLTIIDGTNDAIKILLGH